MIYVLEFLNGRSEREMLGLAVVQIEEQGRSVGIHVWNGWLWGRWRIVCVKICSSDGSIS